MLQHVLKYSISALQAFRSPPHKYTLHIRTLQNQSSKKYQCSTLV